MKEREESRRGGGINTFVHRPRRRLVLFSKEGKNSYLFIPVHTYDIQTMLARNKLGACSGIKTIPLPLPRHLPF